MTVQWRLDLMTRFHAHFGYPFVAAEFDDYFHFTSSTGHYEQIAAILGPRPKPNKYMTFRYRWKLFWLGRDGDWKEDR